MLTLAEQRQLAELSEPHYLQWRRGILSDDEARAFLDGKRVPA